MSFLIAYIPPFWYTKKGQTDLFNFFQGFDVNLHLVGTLTELSKILTAHHCPSTLLVLLSPPQGSHEGH